MARKGAAALPSRGKKQSITFGLVNVPVQLKPAIESRSAKSSNAVTSSYICPAHQQKLKTHRYCEEGDHYPDAVKAFPVDGGYVVLDEDLLDSLVEEKTGAIQIERFVAVDEIDPIYFKAPYLVYPGEGGGPVLDVLAAALKAAGRAAVGTAVLGKQTELVVIRWSEPAEMVVAHTCHFESNLRWQDIALVQQDRATRGNPAQAHVDMAVQVLEALDHDFDASAVADEYNEALRQLIEQAAGGKKLAAPKAKKAQPVADADALMGALKASVDAAKGKPKAKTNGKAASRRKAKV